MLLESWPLSATMWDGDILAGPVPTLFAEDADLSSEAITSDPARAHGDLAKLYRAFFMPEHVPLPDAVELLRKPRAGAALFSFRRSKYTAPVASAPLCTECLRYGLNKYLKPMRHHFVEEQLALW